jgi:hypothetical protein
VACVLTFSFAVVLGAVAVALLGLRDFYANQAREEARPVEDRIREIKDDAAKMAREFERHNARQDPRGKRVPLPPIIDYYRRLEVLAATPTATPEEAMRLDDEALRYAREHELKSLFVMNEPRRLATLLKKRKSASSSDSATNC